MKNLSLAAVLGLMLVCSTANATPVSWIDWTSTTTGALDVNGTTVNVSLTGPAIAVINGDTYYNNSNTGGTYGGLVPSDAIQVNQGGTFTLTFDQAIIDPYMSLISVGQRGYGVTYSFDDAFSVVSEGSNFWGYAGYSVSGNDFTGTEFNGILQFSGAFTSISFDVSPYEHWHGFNFGTTSVADVPEPAIAALFGIGILGLMLTNRRKQS